MIQIPQSVLLSGGLDSMVCAALAREARLFGHRADDRLWPASPDRARGGADDRGAARRRSPCRSAARPARVRRIGADRRHRRCRRTASGDGIPVTYVPARNTIFLCLALGLGRSERRARHLHRRQRARLFGLSRLPPGIHRRVRATRRTSRPRRASRAARFTVHAPLQHMTKADIAARGARLGLDAGLSWSATTRARRAALRRVRRLPAARQGVRRGGDCRPDALRRTAMSYAVKESS